MWGKAVSPEGKEVAILHDTESLRVNRNQALFMLVQPSFWVI
jgi:hypothetical protein